MTFKNKLYAELLLADSTTGTLLPQTYSTSTVAAINSASQYQLTAPIMTSHGSDQDFDGIFDQWNITAGFRLPSQTQITSLDMIASFGYETDEFVNM